MSDSLHRDSLDEERILALVRNWPAPQRLHLALAILASLRPEIERPPHRKVLASEAAGILSGPGLPSSDADVERLLDEHLRERYG